MYTILEHLAKVNPGRIYEITVLLVKCMHVSPCGPFSIEF
jgi:hypothetical protein